MEELPSHIGPYEVRDRLGHGGMGVVYLGFDPMLDRPVAIKVLRMPDEETRRRFLREARLAAKVHHPNIVSIYAVGEHEGNPYLAMEFIAGRTLAQIIRSGEPVPLSRKVHWLAELCAGLAHAHQSGIVHRDVKPSNLLIAQGSQTLRLVDFGIAHGNETSGMTLAGMIVGTPQYMSPEQITGQPVDARSDLFSVGSVAYEMLTGQQAFFGDNLYHLQRKIVGDEPVPLERFVPDVPQPLLKAIQRCLAKAADQRPPNATELRRDFLAIARRLDPDHTLVARTDATAVTEQPKDATTARQQVLRDVETALEQGDLTVASDLLRRLEGATPSRDVLQLRQRIQARRLDLRVEEAVARADDAVRGGTVEESESAIAALADIAARHPELERLRQLHQARLDERMVANLTSRARRALDQEDAVAARKAIDAIARIDPGHADLSRLRTRLMALTSDPEPEVVVEPSSDALATMHDIDLGLSRGVPILPEPAYTPDDTPASSSSRNVGPIAAAVLVLLALGGGAYMYWLRSSTPATELVTSTTNQVQPPGTSDVATNPPGTPDTPAQPTTEPTAIVTETPVPEARPADRWQTVRSHAEAGRFDRAMAALAQVDGASASELQAQRRTIVEAAIRQTLAARRGAEDLQLTRSAQYVLGTTKQADADRARTAGRLDAAVQGYMDARTHFLQAFTDSGKTAPPSAQVVPTPAPEVTPSSTTPTPAPSATGPDLSTWSVEEARAALSQFCGAYLGRDIGLLNRLWPTMDPSWRTEFRAAFETSGELVCVFENATVIRTSDEFSARATLITQLPGGDLRRRALTISLVPARDRLVIGTIRVR